MATLEARLDELLDEVGLDYKTFRTWLFGSATGTLADLTTTDKTSIRAAIAEVKAAATGAPPDATEAQKGVVVLASLLEMAAGSSDTKVATVHGVRQEINTLRDTILGGAGEMADTLAELHALATAAEETDAINNLITIVNGKANAADVYSKAEIDAMLGDTDRDLVAAYQAAKA